ncbi:MAG: site-specific DNA-methyltransferase [Promethearchaeota archaeon]
MNDIPFKIEFDRRDLGSIPDLRLQILENYLATVGPVGRDSGTNLRRTARTIQLPLMMQYLSGGDGRRVIAGQRRIAFQWANLLIWGDNLYVMKALQSSFAGKVQLVYVDPPFYAGTDERMDIPLGRHGRTVKKSYAPAKEIAYRNVWAGPDSAASVCAWFYSRAALIRELLHDEGFLFVRFDYHYGHYVKLVLDEIFGESNFLCEFFVRRMRKAVSNKAKHTQTHLPVQFDSLFLYRKTSRAKLQGSVKKVKRKNGDPAEYASGDDNLWLDVVGYEKTKKTFYPTENSERLLARVISLCSSEGDLVADFFAGSGTTVVVAQRMNRRWIAVDLGRLSINEIRKRVLNETRRVPFKVLNLETYRKYVLYLNLKGDSPEPSAGNGGAKVGAVRASRIPQVIDKVERYHRFMLDLFAASYNPKGINIQGLADEGRTAVHVAAVDSIVGPLEIEEAITETKQLKLNRLVVLGWDYFMEVKFFGRLLERTEGVDVDLRLVPSTVLDLGSSPTGSVTVHFPKLPFLEFDQVVHPRQRRVTLKFRRLHSTVPPQMSRGALDELGPTDLVDFWAVDWDFRESRMFSPSDYDYRKIGPGRSVAGVPATMVEHEYRRPGTYTVVISVVDIFGHDCTEYFQLSFR